MKKVNLAFKAKAQKVLDRMEDPRETLDYSYQRQLELLTKVRHGAASAGASRARVEAHMKTLRREQAALDDQTGLEPGAGEGRQVLRRKAELEEELSRLAAEHNSLRAEEEQLAAARDRLQMKVETFRVRKDSIKGTYSAAESQARVNLIWSGFTEEVAGAGMDPIPDARRRELLAQLRSGIEEITACVESLDREMDSVRQWQTELEHQAHQAPGTGEEELPHLASELLPGVSKLISDLSAHRHSLHADEEKLKEAYDRLAATVQASQPREEDAQDTDAAGEGGQL